MARYRYVLADVFTDTPLTGNQLAVFTDGRDLDSATMQDIAREMNLSETVFRPAPRPPPRPTSGSGSSARAGAAFAVHPDAGQRVRPRRPSAEDRDQARTEAGWFPSS